MKLQLIKPETLRALQEIRWNASLYGAHKVVVAGGCLRDALLGRDVQDIDVFHDGEIDCHYLEELDVAKLDQEYKRALKVLVDNSGDKPVQYIQVEDVEQRIATFSTPLSQLYVDDPGLVITEGFLQAVAAQELRFRPGASAVYKAKLKAKYPEFAVVEET